MHEAVVCHIVFITAVQHYKKQLVRIYSLDILLISDFNKNVAESLASAVPYYVGLRFALTNVQRAYRTFHHPRVPVYAFVYFRVFPCSTVKDFCKIVFSMFSPILPTSKIVFSISLKKKGIVSL